MSSLACVIKDESVYIVHVPPPPSLETMIKVCRGIANEAMLERPFAKVDPLPLHYLASFQILSTRFPDGYICSIRVEEGSAPARGSNALWIACGDPRNAEATIEAIEFAEGEMLDAIGVHLISHEGYYLAPRREGESDSDVRSYLLEHVPASIAARPLLIRQGARDE